MDQPGKVANPACGQLNRENNSSLSPFAPEKFGLARQIRPSRPASACSHTQSETDFINIIVYYINSVDAQEGWMGS